METFGNRNYKKWHNELSGHIVNAGVGNLQGMRHGVFYNCMNNKKKGSMRINARAMKGVEHFVNHWEGEKKNYVVGMCIV